MINRWLSPALSLVMMVSAMSSFAVEPYICSANDLNDSIDKKSGAIRVATFNAFLNRNNAGDLINDLQDPENAQIAAVAEIIQRVRPDVLFINELDYDADGTALKLFQENFLSVSQNKQRPIKYPHVFNAESNTGIPSGLDFDNDGSTTGPGDAYGFGFFPGQYGMALLSQYPIKDYKVRTFQKFLWKDMPGALLPDDLSTAKPADYYSKEELKAFRLSSKSHWDIPLWVNDRILHILGAHPTPPVFDGEEDRNGRRNHDEIRFWADYVKGGKKASYIYDDQGRRGGLDSRDAFVIVGDYNADPHDGDSTNDAIWQLLDHPRIAGDIAPGSQGGVEDSALEGQSNIGHLGNAALDTGDFNPAGPGNLRVDYVLPSKRRTEVICGGVYWPTTKDETRPLVGDGFPVVSSDHHLVWMDFKLKGPKY